MMLDQPHRRREAERQRRYAKRLREGVGLNVVPLDAAAVDVLVALGWLAEGAETDRVKVAEAIAAPRGIEKFADASTSI